MSPFLLLICVKIKRILKLWQGFPTGKVAVPPVLSCSNQANCHIHLILLAVTGVSYWKGCSSLAGALSCSNQANRYSEPHNNS